MAAEEGTSVDDGGVWMVDSEQRWIGERQQRKREETTKTREATRDVGRKAQREGKQKVLEGRKGTKLLSGARTEDEPGSPALADLWLRRTAFSLHTKDRRRKKLSQTGVEACGKRLFGFCFFFQNNLWFKYSL